MATKVEAAFIAAHAGVPVVVTSAGQAAAALAGERVGTLFAPLGCRPSARQFWLALRQPSRVAGCCSTKARCGRSGERHASLLAAGITGLAGRLPRR